MNWQLPTDAGELPAVSPPETQGEGPDAGGGSPLRTPPWVRLSLSAAFATAIGIWLHEPWAPVFWLALVFVWLLPMGAGPTPSPSSRGGWFSAIAVLAVAVATRFLAIGDLPQGAYVDEFLLYLKTVERYHNPFDLFGQTALSEEGWVQVANLHLYFNWLVFQVFGTGYFGLKMLSVVPGVLTALAFFGICRELWQPRVALAAGLLFAVSHWAVRFSRYGGGGSFSLMAFTVAVWLLVRALREPGSNDRNRRGLWLSGFACGLGLYGYVAARLGVASLLLFLALEWLLRRDRAGARRMLVFGGGLLVAALPLLWIYVQTPATVGVRAGELSIFGHAHWPSLLWDNAWRHLGMFHFQGGLYARDNYPGLPMLDPLSGLLFLVGLAFLLRRIDLPLARLLGCTLAVNLVGGLLSVSQEGAPYVLRVAAVMVPAGLILATGLQWLSGWAARRWPEGSWVQGLPMGIVLPALALNLWLYFGLESRNLAATRVMGYELRLLTREVDRSPHPVLLLGDDIFARTEPDHYPEEEHAGSNPTFVSGPSTSLASVFFLSQQFDPWRPLRESLAAMNRHHGRFEDLTAPGRPSPVVAVCKASNRELVGRLRELSSGSIRFVQDIRGRDLFAVATVR